MLCVTVGVVVRCCVQERGRSRRSECASERASCCCERRAAAGQLDECLELRCCSCEQRGGSDERPIERARECDGGWSGLWAGWTQCWWADWFFFGQFCDDQWHCLFCVFVGFLEFCFFETCIWQPRRLFCHNFEWFAVWFSVIIIFI